MLLLSTPPDEVATVNEDPLAVVANKPPEVCTEALNSLLPTAAPIAVTAWAAVALLAKDTVTVLAVVFTVAAAEAPVPALVKVTEYPLPWAPACWAFSFTTPVEPVTVAPAFVSTAAPKLPVAAASVTPPDKVPEAFALSVLPKVPVARIEALPALVVRKFKLPSSSR